VSFDRPLLYVLDSTQMPSASGARRTARACSRRRTSRTGRDVLETDRYLDGLPHRSGGVCTPLAIGDSVLGNYGTARQKKRPLAAVAVALPGAGVVRPAVHPGGGLRVRVHQLVTTSTISTTCSPSCRPAGTCGASAAASPSGCTGPRATPTCPSGPSSGTTPPTRSRTTSSTSTCWACAARRGTRCLRRRPGSQQHAHRRPHARHGSLAGALRAADGLRGGRAAPAAGAELRPGRYDTMPLSRFDPNAQGVPYPSTNECLRGFPREYSAEDTSYWQPIGLYRTLGPLAVASYASSTTRRGSTAACAPGTSAGAT